MTYQQEEDKLLETILDKRFFSVWRTGSSHPLYGVSNVELYLTSDCNLNCEYCYLRVRGDQLYPREHRSEAAIMANLVKFLEWMVANEFSINELQLFSGEIWHLPLGHHVLDTLLGYVQRGLKAGHIMIPTNTTFALEDDTLVKMQEFIDSFRTAGCPLVISHSIDGLLLEDISRPMKATSKVRDQAFYDRVFTFAKKNGFLFHPMVAAVNIEQWPDNYDWFVSMFRKYDIPFPGGLMMLEVRNPDWTPAKLVCLDTYYQHQINHIWDEVNHDYDEFLRVAFGIGADDGSGYSNIAIIQNKTQSPCTVSMAFTVRIGDLMVVPCHRTAYPQFSYGKFNEDMTISAINTQVAIKLLYSNHKTSIHGCDVCAYRNVCMRQCFGEQYEATEEIFMPDSAVCSLFHAKFNSLINKYTEMGLLQYMSTIEPTDTRYIMIQRILVEVDRINEIRNGGAAHV